MLEGAIFDMDGVLLDNADFHVEAFRVFGREQGVELSREAVFSVFGQKNRDMLRALLRRELSEGEIDRFAARKEEIYRELIRPVLRERVVPGLFELLGLLDSTGTYLALATSGPIENVDLVLDGLDLRKYFSAIVTGRDVRRGKPDPECFLLAAGRLGLDPAGCVVFEDSVSGVRAALSAGCICVAIATTHPRQHLQVVRPNVVVEDFRGFGPEQLSTLGLDPGL